MTPWTVALQLPLSMDSPDKSTEWVAISSPRGFPDPGIKPMSPALAGGDSLPLGHQGSPTIIHLEQKFVLVYLIKQKNYIFSSNDYMKSSTERKII